VIKELLNAYLNGWQAHRTRDIPVSQKGFVIKFWSNHENLFGFSNFPYFGKEGLGFSIRDFEGIHDLDFSLSDAISENAAKGQLTDFLGYLL
jgi:hypothetical protein